MRDRKEIDREWSLGIYTADALILEVLLDIRDLLNNP